MKLSKKQRQEIVILYQQGQNTVELAKKYNVTNPTIGRILKENNITVRPRSALTIRKACKLYKEGKTLKHIAEMFSITETSVNKKLQQANIKKRKAHDYPSPVFKTDIRNKIEEIIKLYNLGRTTKEIGNIFNASTTLVNSLLKEWKIKIRTPAESQKYRINRRYNIKQICNDYEKEILTKDICRIHSISRPVLYRILKECGIRLRKHRTRNQIIHTFKSKQYILPSGQEIYVQGYEDGFLDFVINNNILTENEIVYRPPTIYYFEKGKKKRYYPDFYIPKLNLIVEIKSSYIMKIQTEINLELKKNACIEQGYDFICILDKNYEYFKNVTI